jgi:hypothetical protein
MPVKTHVVSTRRVPAALCSTRQTGSAECLVAMVVITERHLLNGLGQN